MTDQPINAARRLFLAIFLNSVLFGIIPFSITSKSHADVLIEPSVEISSNDERLWQRIWVAPVYQITPLSQHQPRVDVDDDVEKIIESNPNALNDRIYSVKLYAFRLVCSNLSACASLPKPSWIGALVPRSVEASQRTVYDEFYTKLAIEFDPIQKKTWRNISSRSRDWDYWRVGRSTLSRFIYRYGPDSPYDDFADLKFSISQEMTHRFQRAYLGLEYIPFETVLDITKEMKGNSSNFDASKLDVFLNRENVKRQKDEWLALTLRISQCDVRVAEMFLSLFSDATVMHHIFPIAIPQSNDPTFKTVSNMQAVFDRYSDRRKQYVESFEGLKQEYLRIQKSAIEKRIAKAIESANRYRDMVEEFSKLSSKFWQFAVRLASFYNLSNAFTPDGRRRLVVVDDASDLTLNVVASFLRAKGWSVVYAATRNDVSNAINEHYRQTGKVVSVAFLSHGQPGSFSQRNWNFSSNEAARDIGQKVAGKVDSVTLFSCSVAEGVDNRNNHVMREIAKNFSGQNQPVKVGGFDAPIYVEAGQMLVRGAHYYEVVPK